VSRDMQTWEWTPEYRAAMEELSRIMIRNPEPNRTITFSDLGGADVVQPDPNL
jgi:hypothetical protein